MRLQPLISFLLLPFVSPAQNLLVNGSFEDENICTEYHEPCAPEGWFGNTGGFKNYFVDSAVAYDGTHYLAIEAGRTRNKYSRSYTRTQLLCSMRPGNKYRVQFFMKAPTDILDSIGIYFTPYDFLFDRNTLQKIDPTAYVIDQNKPDSGNQHWQKITFMYTAKGDEKYLTIANFSKRDINGETGLANETHFFAYLDAVSLTPVNPDERLCGDWEKAKIAIYQIDDRHEYFERYVRFYRSQNKMADPPKLSLTRMYKSARLVLNDDLFTPGRGNLQNNGFTILDNFCNRISSSSVDYAEIGSYTDTTGNIYAADEISTQRAALIKEYVRRKFKIDEKLIKVNGSQKGQVVVGTAKPKRRTIELLFYLHE